MHFRPDRSPRIGERSVLGHVGSLHCDAFRQARRRRRWQNNLSRLFYTKSSPQSYYFQFIATNSNTKKVVEFPLFSTYGLAGEFDCGRSEMFRAIFVTLCAVSTHFAQRAKRCPHDSHSGNEKNTPSQPHCSSRSVSSLRRRPLFASRQHAFAMLGVGR